MYLVIQNDTKTKSYQTTNDCPKPYLKLKDGAQIPLTTNTTNGFYYNVKTSESHTSSESYLTSDTESSGMSNVTALTSEVVDTYYSSKADSAGLSSTTALTRESTSGYLTRSSTSGYGTSGQTTDVKVTMSYRNNMSSSYVLMSGTQITSSNNGGANILYVSAANKVSYRVSYTEVTNSYGNTGSQSYARTDQTSELIAGRIYNPAFTSVSKDIVDKINVQTTFNSSFATMGYYYYGSFSLTKNAGVKTVTTATLTRSSTYSTLTCESTSGYSGVSSSSSESTSGYTGYSSSETTVINSAIMRPKEYNSASASESYYTSALSPDGMSSTTALTSEVVDTFYSSKADSAGLSSTTALTRASTSGYGTDGYKVVEVTRSYKTDIQSITGGPGGTSAYNNHQTVYNKEMLLVNKNNSLYYSTNKSFSSAEAYGTMGHDTGYTTDLKNNRSYSQECMYRTVTALTSSTYSAYAASNFYYSISQTATMRTSESSVTTATYTRSSTSGYSGVSSSTSEATTGYSGVSSSSYTSAAWEED